MRSDAAGRRASCGRMILGCLLLVVGSGAVFPPRLPAQPVPGEAAYDMCQKLVKKDVKSLTNEELKTLAACLEPMRKRETEKANPATSLPQIQQQAPIRIYGR